MAEVICDSKSFTITLEAPFTFPTWSVTKQPGLIPVGGKDDFVVMATNNNSFRIRIGFQLKLADGTVLDASPEGSRDNLIISWPMDGKTSITKSVWAKEKLIPDELGTSVAVKVVVCAKKA